MNRTTPTTHSTARTPVGITRCSTTAPLIGRCITYTRLGHRKFVSWSGEHAHSSQDCFFKCAELVAQLGWEAIEGRVVRPDRVDLGTPLGGIDAQE